jgi:hypothetical protein
VVPKRGRRHLSLRSAVRQDVGERPRRMAVRGLRGGP